MSVVFCYCSDVFLEKHWKSVIHRSICDYFFEAQSKVAVQVVYYTLDRVSCDLPIL